MSGARAVGESATTVAPEIAEKTAPIRVAIIDDHPVVAEGTAALLRSEPDLAIVGIAGSLAAAALDGLDDRAAVDVVLLDLRLGDTSGLTFLTGDDPDRPRVVVLTAYDYPQYVEAARRLGAAGLVHKTAPVSELAAAIRSVTAGGQAFPVTSAPGDAVHLTPRERDVLGLVIDGRSNDEIGAALGIGSKTVETHLARMIEQVGAASRTELATRCVREGWLDVPPA